jgi:BON domain
MRIRTLVVAGAAAAAAAYLLDPRRGKARRRRLTSTVRTFVDRWMLGNRSAAFSGRFEPRPSTVVSTERLVEAAAAPPVPLTTPEPITGEATDDAVTVSRVKEKLGERRDLGTDELVVDVVNGVAYLSGDLRDRHTFGEIVDLTRGVPGVRRVQSLLHIPDGDTVTKTITARRVDQGSDE